MRAVISGAGEDRLLDAAEQILNASGLQALTVREMTRVAGVNLATVNYVFGSKDALLIGLQRRMFGPMTSERLTRLAVFAESGRYSVRDLVRALLEPLEHMRQRHGTAVVELQRHLTAHPEGQVRAASWDLLLPVIPPFTTLLARLLPDIDETELDARVHLVCQFASSIVLDALEFPGSDGTTVDLQLQIDFLAGGLTFAREL